MVFPLAPHGQVFSTRPLGAELLREVESRASGQTVIEIDFTGVRQVSYSFADEFAGALMERATLGQLSGRVRLANVPPKVARVIEGSLRRRGVSSWTHHDSAFQTR